MWHFSEFKTGHCPVCRTFLFIKNLQSLCNMLKSSLLNPTWTNLRKIKKNTHTKRPLSLENITVSLKKVLKALVKCNGQTKKLNKNHKFKF